jgi:hypothetical protein
MSSKNQSVTSGNESEELFEKVQTIFNFKCKHFGSIASSKKNISNYLQSSGNLELQTVPGERVGLG